MGKVFDRSGDSYLNSPAILSGENWAVVNTKIRAYLMNGPTKKVSF